MSEYMKMHQFLKEEEQLQLQLLEKEEKENVKKLRENEIHLTQQVRRINKMIGRIESIYQNLTLESFEVRQNSRGHWEQLMQKTKCTVAHPWYFKPQELNFSVVI